LGIWKDYEELENSLCMPEFISILAAKREKDYEDRKFFAAIQGINLEENSNKGQKEWEDLKARVASGGKAKDSNDITSLQGFSAEKVGFGIGLGLDYQSIKDAKNPLA
jgi:translation initiation factor 1 (eIF-1/SUI1)